MPSKAMNLIHDGCICLAAHVFKALSAKGSVFNQRGPSDIRDITLLYAVIVVRDLQLIYL